MSIFYNHALMNAIREQYRLSYTTGIHGIEHWARVRDNGLRLAKSSGAREDVVELFSALHDACRHNDFGDPGHGPRAAVLAQELHREGLFELDKEGLKLLVRAIHNHTKAFFSPFACVLAGVEYSSCKYKLFKKRSAVSSWAVLLLNNTEK